MSTLVDSPVDSPASTVTVTPAAHSGQSGQSFFDFLTSLHQDEYTGLIVLHFCNGVAKKAEFPGKQVALTGRRSLAASTARQEQE